MVIQKSAMQGRGRMKNFTMVATTPGGLLHKDDLLVLLNDCKDIQKYCRMQVGAC